MQVQFNPRRNYNNYTNYNVHSPSFKMNMNELKGVDQFVAKKYNINPQKHKVLESFYKHCKDLALTISKTDFLGRCQGTKILRKAMLQEWYDYITKENPLYTGAMALMIMKGITSGLKKDDDTLPPVLNKGVLADTLTEVESMLDKDPKQPLNFGKEYSINLQKSLMAEERKLDESLSGWIIIPSEKHDPQNFEQNVDKLKMLSHNNWCTKSYNAEPYLAKGDFHVYMEKGKPKLGVRFDKHRIAEIQGERNNSTIPLSYYDIAMAHVKKYRWAKDTRGEVKAVQTTRNKLKKINKRYPAGITSAPTQKILETFGIKCKKDKDGLLIISEYRQPNNYTFSDLGIDETRLLKDIKIIKGSADFSHDVKDLGSLQIVTGDINFGTNTALREAGSKCILRHKFPKGIENYSTQQILEAFGIKCKKDKDGLLIISGYDQPGNYTFNDLGIDENKLLQDIKEIKGSANFINTNATSMGNIQNIGGQVWFSSPKDTLKQEWGKHILSQKFPKGIENYSTQEILEAFDIKCKKDKDGLLIISEYRLPYSDYTFSDFGIDENKLLKDIKIIKGDAIFNRSQATNLGSVEYIGGYADFSYFCRIESLNKLRHVRQSIILGQNIKDLGELQYIGGDLNCKYSKITSLGNLKEIGGSLIFAKESMVTDLGQLKKIKRDVYIDSDKISIDDLLSKVRVRGKIYDNDKEYSFKYKLLYRLKSLRNSSLSQLTSNNAA